MEKGGEYKMKIAFVCEYSYPSKCGVWNTIHSIARELKNKGHEIHIFSSNLIRGTSKHSSNFEKIEGITYHRFPIKLRITENLLIWNFKKELLSLKPDIIHAHSFRHPHANKVPKIAKKLKIPCYLTTHAPFLEKGIRNPIIQFLSDIFDLIFSRRILNSYNKIFAISKWEIPYLIKIGCKEKRIHYITNGFSKEFLKIKPKHNKKAIYMGRIVPIKNLELLFNVAKDLKDIKFTIYGPIERGYKIGTNQRNVKIIDKPYNIKEQISEFKKNSMFILPSKREGVPQALLEAMGTGLVCISSNTQGGKEIIQNGKTGIIFNKNSVNELKDVILTITKNKKLWEKISKEGKKSVKDKTWEKISKELENIFMRRETI